MNVEQRFVHYFMRKAVLYAQAQEKKDIEIELGRQRVRSAKIQNDIYRIHGWKETSETVVNFVLSIYLALLLPFIFPVLLLAALSLPLFIISADSRNQTWIWLMEIIVKMCCSFDQISDGWMGGYFDIFLRFWKWMIFICIDKCPHIQDPLVI